MRFYRKFVRGSGYFLSSVSVRTESERFRVSAVYDRFSTFVHDRVSVALPVISLVVFGISGDEVLEPLKTKCSGQGGESGEPRGNLWRAPTEPLENL